MLDALIYGIIHLLYKYVVSFYYYNFAIIKSDKYKKIVCAFPGTTNFLQLILEMLFSFIDYIPNKNNEDLKASKMFYDVYKNIKDDFEENLKKSLSDKNSEDYQIIFIGHSLGGALATLASFYYVNQNTIKAEPILITFGQPKVGNDLLAKYITGNIKQIYRIARLNDVVSLIPFTQINSQKVREFMYSVINEIFNKINFDDLNIVLDATLSTIREFFKSILEILIDIASLNLEEAKLKYHLNQGYTHIGGLYIIDNNLNKIYRCKDFYNDNTNHFVCKNKDITLDMLIPFQVLLSNHGYTKINQDMLSGCQEGKKMKAIILRFFPKMKNGLAVCNYNSYNYISNRHLIEGYEQEIKNIKNIESNKEFYLDNTKTDIWLKY